ncbi:putative serine protease PepD [Kribbella amoyensis]|uniref:Putative serine protease PepD n=1 Tax=Kribbella amoyensis TaxID=996641 RepID=A0A561AZI0_9ACTN|nr:trypsin-like peptidase domain-containing protein [Kribbella amoyensis]TWD72035.1 putative serine protease PepD [Kribbella amoyensis]
MDGAGTDGAGTDGGAEEARRGAGWSPLVVALVVVSLLALIAAVGWVRSTGNGGACEAGPVATKAMPSVVTIYAQAANGVRGNGSGQFLDTAGHVLTNNHVISKAVGGGSVTVLRPNGEELRATLVGRDISTDLAVLSVQPQSAVTPIAFGPAPAIGDQVFAIGAPLGLTDTITAGVLSAQGRSVRVPADGTMTALLVSALQTDAAINPGNSGGTLANCDGELIGVPTAGATADDSLGRPVAGSIGLGFAIPGDTAKSIADRLIADGRVQHGDFGLAVVPISRGESTIAPDALYVSSVTPGGPSARAGLRQSDVITALDGETVSSGDQVQEISLSKSPGETVEVQYDRGGAAQTATVTLGE